mgnify:CR=1 FL=1
MLLLVTVPALLSGIVLLAMVANRRQPVRVAEEFAMLDCISGGRLVAHRGHVHPVAPVER